MNFPIDEKKAAQAIARLIEKSGGPTDYLRLVKLVYLADRVSIEKRGVPIVGGKYYSMRKGPTIGEVMDFIGNRSAPDWKGTISPRHGNEIRLERIPPNGALAQAEMDILDAIVESHKSRTTDELVQWCHVNCAEYEHVAGNDRKPITVESILKHSGSSPARIRAIVKEAESMAELEQLLA